MKISTLIVVLMALVFSSGCGDNGDDEAVGKSCELIVYTGRPVGTLVDSPFACQTVSLIVRPQRRDHISTESLDRCTVLIESSPEGHAMPLNGFELEECSKFKLIVHNPSDNPPF